MNRLLSLLLTKLKYIVLVAVLLAVMAFGYTKLFVTEKYTSSAQFIVSMEAVQNKTAEFSYAQQTLNYYLPIFRADDFFKDVADIYNEKKENTVYTSKQIKSMTSISPSSNADEPTFFIRVTAETPEVAFDLAEVISGYAIEKIDKDHESLNKLTIIDSPEPPLSPSSPNANKNTLLGFVIGALLSAAFFVCRELFDGRIKNVEDISNEYDIPVLGVIPDSTADSPNGKTVRSNKKSKDSKAKEGA